MRKIFGFLFTVLLMILCLSQVGIGNVREPAVSGYTKRCDPDNGCPKIIIEGTKVRLSEDRNGDGTYEVTDEDNTFNGYFCFLDVQPDVPCMLEAWKEVDEEIVWSANPVYFTSIDGEVEINIIPDDHECPCK